MENNKKQLTTWRVISVILCVALIVVSVCWILSANSNNANTASRSVTDKTAMSTGSDPLSLWNDNAKLKTELTSYVKSITKEGADYIPAEDRIAVFDFDGTLFNETDPYYFDHMIYL